MGIYVPERKCAGCRSVRPKAELVRIAVVDGRPVCDVDSSKPGRGCYVCKDPECVRLAAEKGGISRSFRKGFSKDSLMELQEELTKLL